MPLTDGGEYLDRHPGFSPGGNTVVFVRVPRGNPTGPAGIWLVETSGEGLRQIAPEGSLPRWVP
ncbi:MAG: hypothetical protein H0X16_11180 [Chloroflexi bacterium]|nr:hypothetical protein [Chloroflexota bacterium]